MKEDFDEAVEQRLLGMMRENPARLVQYFLAILGREMVAANAATMDLSQEMTINKSRYKIKCKSNIKLIKAANEKRVI